MANLSTSPSVALGPLKRYLRHEPKAFMHGGYIHTLPFHTILTVDKWIAGERRDASPSAKMEASLVRAAKHGCFFSVSFVPAPGCGYLILVGIRQY